MKGVLTFVLVVATTYAVVNILKLFGVFNINRSNKSAISKFKSEKKTNKKRNFERFKLELYSSLTQSFGFLYTKTVQENHEYYIKRLNIRSTKLERNYTAEELRGKYIIFIVLGVVFLFLGMFSMLFGVLSGVCIFIFVIYQRYYLQKVKEEDDIIDVEFCNFYLMIYGQLRKGSKGTIKNVTLAYQRGLSNIGNNKECRVMNKFTEYLLANLNMYPDHIAVNKLSERYLSATVINFANLSAQALQGVDNYETLQSFRAQLIRRKTEEMNKRSEKAKNNVNYAKWGIYFILGEFVILSFLAKMPQGAFKLF